MMLSQCSGVSMQSNGGYRYPSALICIFLSCLSLAAGAWVWHTQELSLCKGIALLLILEGTVLWASALTPKGLVPPNAGISVKFCWFLKPQSGVTLSFNQPLFYLGILLLLCGSLLSNVNK